MQVTIEIKIRNKGVTAQADEVHALLPTRNTIEELMDSVRTAVLPVTFRIVQSQTQEALITFGETK